jgi:FixJ family two-component response regulator
MKRPPFSVSIVDDEVPILRALTRLFRAAGFEAHGYESAEAFLSDWKSSSTDCVVLDLQMMGLNGLELLQCLQRLDAKLPVVIITGLDTPGLEARCREAGAASYLRKPLDDRLLLQEIERFQLQTTNR